MNHTSGWLSRPVIVGLLLLAAGCGSEKRSARSRGDSQSDIAPAAIAVRGVNAKDTVIAARQLVFSFPNLENRLRVVGLEPVDAGTVTQPFLSAPGRLYRIPGGELQAYIYGDAVALARETDGLDTLRVAPPRMMVEWAMPPSLIVANNLAVILLTRDTVLRRRVRDALKPY